MFYAHINIFSSFGRWKMSLLIVKADFDIFGKAPFWKFQKGLLEGEGGHGTSWGGPPNVAGQGWSSTMELHMALPYGIFPFGKEYAKGTLGFWCDHSTPWSSYI
jgi:hypothetical protein